MNSALGVWRLHPSRPAAHGDCQHLRRRLFLFPPAAAHQITRSSQQLRNPARSHATALATADSSLVQSLTDWHAQCASSINNSLPAIKNHFVLS